MYLLKNKKEIDEDGICRAMADSSVLNEFFLDTETGEVISVYISFDSNCNEVLDKVKKDKERYFRIPKVSDSEKHILMKDFVKNIIRKEELRNKLNFVLGKNQDFYIFERIVNKDKDGLIHSWVQWKYDYFIEEVGGWLNSLNIGIEEKEEFFDDCPICQLMKRMNEKGEKPKLDELKEAFKETKKIDK